MVQAGILSALTAAQTDKAWYTKLTTASTHKVQKIRACFVVYGCDLVMTDVNYVYLSKLLH